MSKLLAMKSTKAIKRRAKVVEDKEPESEYWVVADSIRQLLKTMRPYDVARMASEVIGRLHEYTRDETIAQRYDFKGYDYFFFNMHSELESMLDNGVLGYYDGDPPYKPEEDRAKDDSAS